MKAEYDVIVVGGGLSGYVAATRAAEMGKRVLLLTDGLGSFPFLPGPIDVWGWAPLEKGRMVEDPVQGIMEHLQSQPGHPWARLLDVLQDSMEFFRAVCGSQGLVYHSVTGRNIMVPTPLGMARPAFATPESQYVPGWEAAEKVLVVGLAEYKDFFPRVAAQGFAGPVRGAARFVRTLTVSLGLPRHVDSFTLAGQLESDGVREAFLGQVADAAAGVSLVAVPAVFGLESAAEVLSAVKGALGVPLMEIATVPPSVPGLRIYTALRRYALFRGVTVTANVRVTGAWFSNGGCAGVTASIAGREHRFKASSFVLATGSFVSSGFSFQGGKPTEPVMGLPVTMPGEKCTAGGRPFLDGTGKDFMRAGIEVDDNLNPIDPSGRVIYKNVFITGSKLAGYDFSVEKSGTGIAVASGYKAGNLAQRGE